MKRDDKVNIPTLVKWAGGKKQLIHQFKPLLPKKIERYIEPFVGGGAVAFYIITNHPEVKEVILSDVNEELINTYKQVRNNVEELIVELKKHKEYHSEKDKEYYLEIRATNPEELTQLKRAARFIYLNKTCFNGIYRVNKNGGFNVPMGRYKNPKICDEESLRKISRLLKKVKLSLSVGPFEKSLSFSKKDDFIYFDPPYYPLKKSSFTTYTTGNFLEENHIKLFELFEKLDLKGCKIMLSNSNSPFIEKLYSQYNLERVNATRMINCDATKRGKIKELVIRNYY